MDHVGCRPAHHELFTAVGVESLGGYWFFLPINVCSRSRNSSVHDLQLHVSFNHLNAELNPICCLLALLGAHHFLHVSRIRVKSLTLRLLMSYIYDISSLRVHTSAHCSGRKQVKG